MGFYKYFWDLTNSTNYETHTVGSFDNNTVTGGGVFKWIQADSSTITNIPGIRIKPIATNNGYWLRVYEGPVQVSWFGCQNTEVSPYTFQQMGVSQATLNYRYGIGFATVNDYYDNTAIRYALRYMETVNNHGLIFESKNYWLSRSCVLPNDSDNFMPERWVIDGSNAYLIKIGNSDFNFFERTEIVDMAAATVYGVSSYTIKNFKGNGLGSAWLTGTSSFLYLPASNGSHIDNIFLEYFPNGIRLEQGPNSKISNINGKNISKRLVLVSSGSWTGAIPTNSGSDASEITHIRSYDSTSNTFSVIEVNGSAGCVVKNCYVEGTPQNTVIYDSQGVASCNSIKIQDMYVPATNQESMIKIKGVDGIYMIDNISFNQSQVFAESDPYSGTPNIRLSNVINWPAGTTMADDGGSTWDFDYVSFPSTIVTPADIVDPTNNLWETTGGYVIPSITEIRNEPPVSTSPIAVIPTLQEVLDYNRELLNGLIFLGTLSGDNNSGASDVIGIGTEAAQNNTGAFVSAVGYLAAKNNTANAVTAMGAGAAVNNTGTNVAAFGQTAGATNTGNWTAFLGDGTGSGNIGNEVAAVGHNAALGNQGSDVVAIGETAAESNTGNKVNAIGKAAADSNSGTGVIAIGEEAGKNNSGNDVIAIGYKAGESNAIGAAVILSNTELPSYLDYTAASAAITVIAGATTGTYLYHDQTTNSIGAVRIP